MWGGGNRNAVEKMNSKGCGEQEKRGLETTGTKKNEKKEISVHFSDGKKALENVSENMRKLELLCLHRAKEGKKS